MIFGHYDDMVNFTYWEERERNINKFWGKGKLILEVAKLIDNRKNILEIGCGEGHLLNSLIKLISTNTNRIVGIDNNLEAIKKARILYPEIEFNHIDITNYSYHESLGKFDVILLVNVLHEIYSLSSINQSIENGKRVVSNTIREISKLLNDGGILVVMDGLEPENGKEITTRFRLNNEIRFYNDFIESYEHLSKRYEMLKSNVEIEMLSCDFVRFITKLRFINSPLWDVEKYESYQYYTEYDFINKLNANNVEIIKVEKFISDIDNWENNVNITYGFFPFEHIIIIGHKRIGGLSQNEPYI